MSFANITPSTKPSLCNDGVLYSIDLKTPHISTLQKDTVCDSAKIIAMQKTVKIQTIEDRERNILL